MTAPDHLPTLPLPLQERRLGQRDIDMGRPNFQAVMTHQNVCTCGARHPGRVHLQGVHDHVVWICGACLWQVNLQVTANLGIELKRLGFREDAPHQPCVLCTAPTASTIGVVETAHLCDACYRARFVPPFDERLRTGFKRAPGSADLGQAEAFDRVAFTSWAQFKQGDRVRCIRPRSNRHQTTLGTVADVDLIHGYTVLFDGEPREPGHRGWLYEEADLEEASA